MLALLITILLQLGIIGSEQEYYQLDHQQQEQYQKEIIIEDTYVN